MQMNKNILDIFEKANVLRETAQNATKEQSDAAVVVKENKQLSGYVGVTGIRIKDDGTITKNDYLKTLQIDENAYAGMSFTDEEVAAISYTMKRQSSGINSSIPIRCTGDMCPFKNSCPYFAIGKAPIMKPCLVEAQLIHHWTEQYMDEFNVDPANITELHMVSELAEFNVYEMRITKYLAENHPTLMQDVVVGIDNTGTVIENQEISKAFDLKDRIKRNRMKVLEALMATRKEKMKIVSEVIGGSTSSQKMAELKSKIMSLSQEVKMMKAEDVEFVEV